MVSIAEEGRGRSERVVEGESEKIERGGEWIES